MMNPAESPLQFKTANYAESAKPGACALCGQSLGYTYYRLNDAICCDACGHKAKTNAPSAGSAYARSVVFGIGAAVLGMILYSTFAIVTGITIGFVSLAVGYLVGKGIKLGSKGSGGRKYQITAALLTYAAVSISAVPIAISEFAKHPQPGVHTQPVVTQPSAPETDQPPNNVDNPAPISASDSVSKSRPSMALAFGALALLGLASPFLELASPANGVIGLFILFIGIRFAWRITAGSEAGAISGPFTRAAEAPPAPL